ncbi:hypothetical protein TCDM_09914 [Trypanosoma cruzi Dm28c]|uniref:Uncharacterized protein n=1 Tax=Trypanosoma cruzi Dm28c TaxID=1416333 RepID=V5B477_TRYCR|nr:hypothetical protein TCDM_09914 [Trypanosoma cruzi Dm28c]
MAPAHTRAAPASLPIAFALCRSGHTHGQQQNHFTLNNPKSTPTSLATQRSQLPARASCRSAIDAETRHSARTYFPRGHSAVCFTHSSVGRRSQKHATKATVIAQSLATSVGMCMDPLLTNAGRQPAAGALVPVHRLQHGKEKTAYSRCTYSHRQHQHAGRQPSFLSTSRNAEKRRGAVRQQCHNPAHISAPPEKKHKLQKIPSTCHPNAIPTHRDMPTRSIRHSMHHARQQLTPVKQMFLGPVASTCCGGK